MKFLLDQDVYAATGRFLEGLKHEVTPVAKIGLAQASDEELLKVAQTQNCLFVTRDRDFGGLVFLQQLGAGVLYLRMLPDIQDSVHQELAKVLSLYSETELQHAFVVIEADGHRFRKLRFEESDK